MSQKHVIKIVAPSSPTAGQCPQRFSRALSELSKFGFTPEYSETVLKVTDFTAGSNLERAEDLYNALQTESIVMSTIGGYNSNDILPFIDNWELKTPSIFIGYSDMTILLYALRISFPNKVQTIHGPMLLPQFGEFGGIHDFTKKSFLHVLSKLGSNEWYELPSAKEYTDEFLAWDQDDNRPRKYKPNNGWEVIKKGICEGLLFPGNLNTFVTLSGTTFAHNIQDPIFFFEDVESESPASLKRNLVHIKLVYGKKIKGLVFGRFPDKTFITKEILTSIVNEVFPKIPTLSNVDFGHTDPILTLPIGHFTQIDTSQPSIKVKL